MPEQRRRALWMAFPLLGALIPHTLYVPAWTSLAVAIMLAWRLSPLWTAKGTLQRVARVLLAGAGVLAIYLQYRTLLGPQAGIGLLTLMAGLKLLESDGRRDHAIVVLVGYFLLMATLIHNQSLPMAAWLGLAATGLTASLVASQSGPGQPVWPTLRLAGGFMLQALPLALILFLLFPRLPAPMTGLVRLDTGRTGLSDSMSPGDVSRLILSDEIAFRVDFSRPGHDARGLYWRGPVLPAYDGRRWTRSPAPGAPVVVQPAGMPIEYAITLEPGRQPWLPVAGLTLRPPLRDARLSADLEWLAPQPVRNRVRYTVSAWLDYRLENTLDPVRRRFHLDLPARQNPQALALGRTWAASAASDADIVRQALTHFRQEPFHYTLTPPALDHEHAVDDFLFRSRRGFCEHYAGAFTVLMRAAGVPARVVTGYQGGEANPLGGHWIVRERDAHAWSEVWLEGRGWVRVDPTGAVAPERVEHGIDAALPANERALLDLPPAWLSPLRQAWDALDNGWNQWVLGYDFHRQRELLSALSPSLASLKGMLWAMLAAGGLFLAVLALVLLRRPHRPRDAVERHYARFLDRLAGIGLVKGAAEGPESFARRAGRERPDLSADIEGITRDYIALRYGHGDPACARRLAGAVREFSPRSQPARR